MTTQTEDDQTRLIAALKSDAAQRKAALQRMFKDEGLRTMTNKQVRSTGGTEEDASDLFHDALIIFDRRVREGGFEGESSVRTYFMGIVRWAWFNKQQRKNKQTLEVALPEPIGGNPEVHYLLQEKKDLLQSVLNQIGPKCNGILQLYQLDYSMQEISELLHYASAEVAKQQVYKCRQMLRHFVAGRPDLLKELKER